MYIYFQFFIVLIIISVSSLYRHCIVLVKGAHAFYQKNSMNSCYEVLQNCSDIKILVSEVI